MNMTIETGASASITKIFTEQDVQQFALLSTDTNPVHLDEQFAANSIFKKRVVHGMLVASLFSAVIGVKLPGRGAIYLDQQIRFKAPVFIGDEITALVEVIKVRESKGILTLKTVCTNASGKIVIDGEAIVKIQGEAEHN